MKRSIILVVCAMSWLFVANTHAVVSHQRVHNKIDASEDKETVFVTSLMQKMTLAEKIGQLSQYVGGELLTGPQSDALSDSLFVHGMVGSILNVGGVEKLRKLR